MLTPPRMPAAVRPYVIWTPQRPERRPPPTAGARRRTHTPSWPPARAPARDHGAATKSQTQHTAESVTRTGSRMPRSRPGALSRTQCTTKRWTQHTTESAAGPGSLMPRLWPMGHDWYLRRAPGDGARGRNRQRAVVRRSTPPWMPAAVRPHVTPDTSETGAAAAPDSRGTPTTPCSLAAGAWHATPGRAGRIPRQRRSREGRFS
jgi:hypothetical protein